MILHPERIVLAFAIALGGAAALVLVVKAGVALARWACRPRGRNSAPPPPPPCPPQATRYSRHAASPDRVGYARHGLHRYADHLTLHPPEKP